MGIEQDEQIRSRLAREVVANAQVEGGPGDWVVALPGQSIAGMGDTLGAAIVDLIDALREYAADWRADAVLREASNHRCNGSLVSLVELSDDTQLTAWLTQAP